MCGNLCFCASDILLTCVRYLCAAHWRTARTFLRTRAHMRARAVSAI